MKKVVDSITTSVTNNVIKWVIAGLSTAVITVCLWTFDLWVAEYHKSVQAQAQIVLDRFVEDQLHKNIDSAISGQKVGFRGALANGTHLSKDKVVDVLTRMILERDSIKSEVNYLFRFTDFTVDRTTVARDTLGIRIFTFGDDQIYQDSTGHYWDAFHKNGKYVCYPPSENNDRVVCYPHKYRDK